MVFLAAAASIIFYLAPIAAIIAARCYRGRPLGQIALDIPFAVAIDLLLVMALTRFLTLETAALLSRPLWLLGAGVWAFRRRRRGDPPAWPAALTVRLLAQLSAIALAAVLLSMTISRAYCIWDRDFHMPLVASMRGQTIPFSNTYDPGRPLHYHIAGDVLASLFQVGSGNVIHSALALSLSHDLLFAMTACAAALLARQLGARRFLPTALVILGVLLIGPVGFIRSTGRLLEGYSFTSYYQLSFRPHAVLAGLLTVGFAGAILAPLFRMDREVAPRGTLPQIVAPYVLLGVTDEASCMTLGVALAAAWLVAPQILHPRRLPGLGVLAALPAAVLGANFLFSAALAPGGPVNRIAWKMWRSPGFYNPPISLKRGSGWVALLLDILPILTALAALILVFLRARSRRRGAALAFVGALSVISLILLTRIQVNGSAMESHRFATAPLLVATLAGVLILPRVPLLSATRIAVLGGMSLAAASTLVWIVHIAPMACFDMDFFTRGRVNLYEVDCREEVGARLGQWPRAEYITSAGWYAYAGCVPVYGPGTSAGWPMGQYPDMGLRALRRLDAEMLPPTGDWFAICPSSPEEALQDPICVKIRDNEQAACEPSGSRYVRCRLPAEARGPLLVTTLRLFGQAEEGER